MRVCENDGCEKTTSNARFCSLSCSNSGAPKRKRTRVGHSCLNCGRVRFEARYQSVQDFCLPCRRLPEIAVAIIGNSSNAPTKERLFKLGLKEPKCENCGITEWMGKPAPLELEHVDGDRKNNWLWNLLILCGNCHRQTETWGPRNFHKRRKINGS